MMDNIYFRKSVFFLLLLFIGLANIFRGIGSTTLIILSVLGLVVCNKDRPHFLGEEKWLMWAFGSYLGAYLLSGAVNGLTGLLEEIQGKHFEKEIYLSLFPLVFIFFRRFKLPQWVVWYGLSAGAIITGGYSLIDFGWLDLNYRVRGAYNPIMYGCLSLVLAFMSIQGYRYFDRQHPVLVIIPVSSFFLGTLSSVLTGSRGAWIAIPTFLFITLLHLYKRIKRRMIALIIGIFFSALIIAYQVPGTGLSQRISLVGEDLSKYSVGDVTDTNSVGLRLASWEASWNIARDHLFLGIGPGGYRPAIERMGAEGVLPYDVSVYYTQPHSIYFAVLVDCGILGLICLLSIFLIPVRIFITRILRSEENKEAAYTGLILVSGYIHFGLTETIFGRNLFVSFYIILLSAFLFLSGKTEQSVL